MVRPLRVKNLRSSGWYFWNVTLADLKDACLRYSKEGTRFDASLRRFRDQTAPTLDLADSAHISWLLIWLRSWGCRQFANAYDSLATESILDWHLSNRTRIPHASMMNLRDEELQEAASAYNALSKSLPSRKKGSDRVNAVTFGATGAAKVLFALRPEALPPWDGAIRKQLRYKGTRDSYLRFLREVQRMIVGLVEEAALKGIGQDAIAKEVGRPDSTLPKLVDEYYFITITRGRRGARVSDPT
jgi:hypothetical protein